MGEGVKDRNGHFVEDWPIIVSAEDWGQRPKAKAVLFPAGANPEAESDVQPGTRKETFRKKDRPVENAEQVLALPIRRVKKKK